MAGEGRQRGARLEGAGRGSFNKAERIVKRKTPNMQKLIKHKT